MVQPQRFQRIGVKSLYGALLQTHKQHTVAEGGGIDGEIRGRGHGSLGHYRTGDGLHFVYLSVTIGHEIIHAALSDEDGTAYGFAAIAVAQLDCPTENRVFTGGRCFHTDYAIVGVVLPEGGPVRGNTLAVRGGCRLFQLDRQLLLLTACGKGHLLPHITGTGGDAGIVKTVHQCERTALLRPDTGIGAVVVNDRQRVRKHRPLLIRHGDNSVNRITLLQRDGVGIRAAVIADSLQDNFFRIFVRTELHRDRNRGKRSSRYRISIGLIDRFAAAYLHTIPGERQRDRQLSLFCRAKDRPMIRIIRPEEIILFRDLTILHDKKQRVLTIRRQRYLLYRQCLGEGYLVILIVGNTLVSSHNRLVGANLQCLLLRPGFQAICNLCTRSCIQPRCDLRTAAALWDRHYLIIVICGRPCVQCGILIVDLGGIGVLRGIEFILRQIFFAFVLLAHRSQKQSCQVIRDLRCSESCCKARTV